MYSINILGTGCAMVTKCYNTCFTISKYDEHFLIDTGGGNTILSNLEKLNIPIMNIHNLFISHKHNDHINGVTWIIRAVAQGILSGNYYGNLKIYCHESIETIIRSLCNLILQEKFSKFIDNRIIFERIEDGSKLEILGIDITFFDILSSKDLQFGFTMDNLNGKSLTYLGDEPYKKPLYKYCYKKNYLMHEAFCLFSQRDIFKPYEKHHSTVKEACENASELQIDNLILYHSEDKTLPDRKKLYTEEGKKYFSGNILSPEDLEIIKI